MGQLKGSTIIVMPGGDLLLGDSKMNVIGVEFGDLTYKKSSGTSFATPLAVNLAAKIVSLYPTIKMQTVKALIINGAESLNSNYLDQLIEDLKQQDAGRPLNDLSRSEKIALSKKYSLKRLNQVVSGHGVPDSNKCLYSDEKRVILLVEDSLMYDCHKVVNLNLPSYLFRHSKAIALKITATLCYKFSPVLGNSLGYNPVHISFNIGNSIVKSNPAANAEAYAKCRKEKDNSKMAIKSSFFSWSDDFYPASNKMFSNVQKFQANLSASEAQKIEGQLSVIVRCTVRNDTILAEKVQKEHEFSLVFCVEETTCEELTGKDLYSEMMAINQLEAIAELLTEIEIDNATTH